MSPVGRYRPIVLLCLSVSFLKKKTGIQFPLIQSLGHVPFLMQELKRVKRGKANSLVLIFNTLAGMQSPPVAFLTSN